MLSVLTLGLLGRLLNKQGIVVASMERCNSAIGEEPPRVPIVFLVVGSKFF